MKIDAAEVVTWLIVGALAGTLAGMLVTGKKEGFGRVLNSVVGLVGAIIGGLLFKWLDINLGTLKDITVSLQQVIAAFLGSLVLLGIIWLTRRQLAKRKQTTGSAAGNKQK